jgi:DNA-binding NarL/FixJ family response regulator
VSLCDTPGRVSAPAEPSVLIVADPERIAELAGPLDEPLPDLGEIDILNSSGGDDAIDLFRAKRPEVVVVTATLEAGDAKSLIDAVRGMAARAEVAVVLIGDAEGPVRTALDALDMSPERFVSRPLAAKALRFAVGSAIEMVRLARGMMDMKPTDDMPSTVVPKESTSGVSSTTTPGLAVAGATPAAQTPAAQTPSAQAPAADAPPAVNDAPTASTRAALRARWEAIADSINDAEELDDSMIESIDEPEPLPPVVKARTPTEPGMGEPTPHQPWKPASTDPLAANGWQETPPEAPTREPTLILSDHGPPPPTPVPEPSAPFADDSINVAARRQDERWSEPMPLAALVERDSVRDIDKRGELDDIPLDDFDDDIIVGHDPTRRPALEVVPPASDAQPAHDTGVHDNRDFARQLRAKMSMMAQRLFQGDAASSPAVDLAPRHDHHTEIDLASLGEEPALAANVTQIEARASRPPEPRDLTTSPGTWDTQVRERGLPDTGEVVRGVSDAAMLLAKMFAQGATGRVAFRRDDLADRGIDKVVYFDQGRPVFAASSYPRDRMGELLVREGKITAAQFERCQTHVAESGRRMGEILVDFGYLKRRELLPAVRRHVEDIVYSLFGWDRGTYRITIDTSASAERIRLSRHPASLILEGIRRKLDRTSLDRLVGPPSTVIEVRDRDRLGGIINTGELGPDERAALSAFDGQADLTSVARAANVDIADVLPLAWGLCVLGLAIARRADTEVADESTALVGETDLAIDRERVRARWQLVTEADYFALLGVRRDATAFEIRRAYQSARRDFAADCFPVDLRRELAQELDDIAHVLDEAFRVLRDDRLRQTYLSNLIE